MTLANLNVTAGTFIYVAAESAEFANYLGFAPNYTAISMAIDGGNAIELFENSAVIDVFGDINTDGTGHTWEYTKGWAYRVSGMPASTVFATSDWKYSGINALDGSRYHIRNKKIMLIKYFSKLHSSNKCCCFCSFAC